MGMYSKTSVGVHKTSLASSWLIQSKRLKRGIIGSLAISKRDNANQRLRVMDGLLAQCQC